MYTTAAEKHKRSERLWQGSHLFLTISDLKNSYLAPECKNAVNELDGLKDKRIERVVGKV